LPRKPRSCCANRFAQPYINPTATSPVPRQSSHLHRYLDRHAEPEAIRAAQGVTGSYRQVLVVPCFDEPAQLLDSLLPSDVRDLLLVLVINTPDNAADDARQRTRALLEQLGCKGDSREITHDAARNVGLLVIDRVSCPIPRRQGVGLARKIGSDCAAALWQYGRVADSWIYSTDADVQLPSEYFEVAMPSRGATVFPFRHHADSAELQHKADLYELHMRYYKSRLEWAGSPYAFHTLGSTLAVHPEDYAMVRGYPRRNAGEDFYLLNKLCKVAPIHSLEGPVLSIRARYSSRTPFGTGASLTKISDASAYPSYAAESFQLLRRVLVAFANAGNGHDLNLDQQARQILDELGFGTFFTQAQAQYTKTPNLHKAIADWFDGFRTLRFIHECRRHFPDAPLRNTLGQLFPAWAGQSAHAQAEHFLAIDRARRKVTSVMRPRSQKRQDS